MTLVFLFVFCIAILALVAISAAMAATIMAETYDSSESFKHVVDLVIARARRKE